MSAFFQRSRPRLLRLLACLHVPEGDREDLLQDALVEMVTQWSRIEHLEPWLLGTLRHKCFNYARSRRRVGDRLVVVDSSADLEQLAGPAPELDHDGRLDLARVTRNLPLRQQRILWLFYGLGLNERELSERTPATARHGLHKDRWRAISQLRRVLLGVGDPD